MRLVSLVPSLSHLIHVLGRGSELVGVTRFCTKPDTLTDTCTVVGGTKNVKLDVVRDLAPTHIFAVKEENERSDVDALRQIAPVQVYDIATIPDALAMIEDVGVRVEAEAEAQTLITDIRSSFDALQERVAATDRRPRVAYLIWRDPYMAAGGDTFIHDVLERGGFDNAFGDRTRYPEVDVAALRSADPDVVFCSTEPFPFHQKDRFTDDLRQALPDIPVTIVDGELFSWYGAHIRTTAEYLATLHARWTSEEIRSSSTFE